MLEPIVNVGKIHIEGCSDCLQRCFFCSICFNQNDPLFSFQLEKVYQCDECGALSHAKCFNRERRRDDWKCTRCERIRRKQ
uniref:Rubicon Homology domain-containing protein n=1 Tax=Panagrolaimus sp. ES5 TaxID=591445 RepID=A0AC34GMS4_9BILA